MYRVKFSLNSFKMDLAGTVIAAETRSLVLRTKCVAYGPPISMALKRAMMLLEQVQQIFVWIC